MSTEQLLAVIGEHNRNVFSGRGPNLLKDDIDDDMRDVLMKAIKEKVIDLQMDSEEAGSDSWDAVWTALRKVSDVDMHRSMGICDMAVIEI